MFNDPVNCAGHSLPDRVLRSNVPKGWRRLRYTPFGANVSCGGPWQCSAKLIPEAVGALQNGNLTSHP